LKSAQRFRQPPSWVCFAKRKAAHLASHGLAPFTYRALNRLRKTDDSRCWATPLERLVSQLVHEPQFCGISAQDLQTLKLCCRLLKFDNTDYEVATNIGDKSAQDVLHRSKQSDPGEVDACPEPLLWVSSFLLWQNSPSFWQNCECALLHTCIDSDQSS